MIVEEEVDIATVRRHEQDTNSAVRLGTHNLDRICETSQFRCCRVQLEWFDSDRLYLLRTPDFVSVTRNQSCRLSDVLPDASAIQRVVSFTSVGIDLRLFPCLALVLVATDLHGVPLIAIDGNHRAIAQFLTHKTVDGVPAFVCIHPGIDQWGYVPPLAQTYTRVTRH